MCLFKPSLKAMQILAALAVTAIPAFCADVAGRWRLTGQIAEVAIDRLRTLRQTSNKIEGSCKNQAGEVMLSGEVDGKSVTWKYEAKYQDVPVLLVFQGSLESETEVKGSITASDLAGNNATTGTFSAKKQ